MDITDDITQPCNEPVEPNHIDDFDRDHYSIGYSPLGIRGLSKRSVYRDAAFFLPYLCPGIDLLDCGCGPGTITVDMAEIVSPGNVVGIDMETSQFQAGRIHASERGILNIRFEVGNVYKLPFSDGSFDAVFVHALLYQFYYLIVHK